MNKSFLVSYKKQDNLYFKKFTNRDNALKWCNDNKNYKDLFIIHPNGKKEKYQR